MILLFANFGSSGKLYANTENERENARFELATALALSKQQLAKFEGAQSLTQLEEAIANYELAVFRDAIDLAEPWMLLGDAYMQAGRLQSAADAYEQSIHITRVNLGLFAHEQLDTVHRQSALLEAMGDTAAATGREEYALVLQRRKIGQRIDLAPALQRMADWYTKVSEPGKARHIYAEAIGMLEDTEQADTSSLVHAYTGLANSYLLERFPPKSFYQEDDRDFSWQGPEPQLSRWNLSQGMFFGPANRALLKAEDILRPQAPQSKDAKEQLTEVMVRLGDLNILFEKWTTANTWYRSVFELWGSQGDAATVLAQWFDRPAPLHLPLPSEIGRVDDYPAERISAGHITLAFSLSSHGKVGRIETLDIEPERFRDLRFRRVLRESRYRPRIEQGTPVRSERVLHRHEFLYVLEDEPSEEES